MSDSKVCILYITVVFIPFVLDYCCLLTLVIAKQNTNIENHVQQLCSLVEFYKVNKHPCKCHASQEIELCQTPWGVSMCFISIAVHSLLR